MHLGIAAEYARTLRIDDDKGVDGRFQHRNRIDGPGESHGRRMLHGRNGRCTFGGIDVGAFAENLLRGVEERNDGIFVAGFETRSCECSLAEGRVRRLDTGDLRSGDLVQLHGERIEVRGAGGFQLPVDADGTHLAAFLVHEPVDAGHDDHVVHIVIADPRPAVLETIGVGRTDHLDDFGFRLRVGSHRLLASVAFAPGNHDRLPVTHHGAVNQAAGVDDIFRIGRIVVDDLHKTLELGAVITRADTLLPDHNHGHRLVGLRLTDDAHVAARSARIVLVHREDRAGCDIQLRIAVEIDRSGVETRTRSDVELRPFGNDVVRCGMAVHVERTAAAGFEPIHPGHTFLVGHRIVGHVEGPVDGNRAVLAVVKLGVGIEPEISTFDLAVVVELRLVGDFDFTRLQCGRRSVVELARGVDVEQSVDNERAFVDDGLAGKARLVGRKSTALEYIDGRIDRILLEVGFRLLDIYFTARKHRKGRLSDSNRRIERQFARHVENRSGMGRELAVQIDIARNLGARGNVIFRRRGIGFGDPAGSEVDIARRS